MKSLYLLIISLIAITACNKPGVTTSPPYKPTQTGADILYFKINGDEHLYKNKRTYLNDNGVDITIFHCPDSGRAVQLHADDVKYNDNLYMLLETKKGQAGEIIPDLNIAYKMSHFFYGKSMYIHQIINTTGNHTFEYLVDTVNSYITFTRFDDKVVSGIFYFEAHYKDSLHVTATDGFFDIIR